MLAILAAALLAQSPVYDLAGPILSNPALKQLAFFEFAPLSGAGMPASAGCYSAGSITGTRQEALTFSRASVAEVPSNDGQTYTQCSSGQVRVSSGANGDSWLGIWTDPAATNLATQARDLSQAVWVKTSMTCAKTATGMRNDANGASTCTSSGANGTVLQTVTVAAAARATSLHLKRRTGTGAVSVTRDNGTTYTDVSASLSGSVWKRVVPTDTPGCAGGNCIVVAAMTSGGANPVIGLKFATSGDAVDVDFVQDEVGEVATSPIETTAASATRLAEVASMAHAAGSTYSMAVLAQVSTTTFTQYDSPLYDYFNGNDMGAITSAQGSAIWPGIQCATQSAANTSGSVVTTSQFRRFPKYAYPFTPFSCVFGTPFYQDIRGRPYSGTSTTPSGLTNTVYFGQPRGAGKQWRGVIKGVRLGRDQSSGLWERGTLPTGPAIAWLGDSITGGAGSEADTDYLPPDYLTPLASKAAFNFGLSGDTAAQCLDRWRSQISGKGYSTLVVLCGVNSIAADLDAATTFASLQTIYTEAAAQGIRVIPVLLTPWANSLSPPVWSAGRQTVTDTVNASIVTWATNSNGGLYVDTASLGSGSPLQLLVGHRNGGSDLVHLSASGRSVLATLVNGAAP